MVDENKSGSRFIVDLGDLKLSDIEEKQVGAEIQAVVLRELARTTLSIQIPWHEIDIFNKCDPTIWGMCIERKLKGPFGISRGGLAPLAVEDHTLIMRAIMEHPFHVFRKLPDKYKSKSSQPSGKQVLEAALQVEQIDNYTKDRIRVVLTILPKIEKAMATLPETIQQTLDDLRVQLADKTIRHQIKILRDYGHRIEHAEDGLAVGMEVAAQMLEDGQDSIYSSDFSFYELLREREVPTRRDAKKDDDPLGTIANGDEVGAVAGGAAGFLVAGVGAGPGGLAGGLGGSVGAVFAVLTDWLL